MAENNVTSAGGNDVKLTKLAECAGCGAKVGAGELAKLLKDIKVQRDPNLLVGFDKSDDAAVYRVTDDVAIVETVDFFPPIADDPYTYGAIAATNALSDVYAMGGEPKVALNVMAVPEDMPSDVVHEILRGGYEKVYEAGASIVGGHSIYDEEPKYGLAVTGFVDPHRMLTNSGARPGDVLVLTKALGVGVITTAEKGGLADPVDVAAAERQMMCLNRWARDVIVRHDVHATTDVTGFGLMGHSLEMAQGAGVRAVIDAGAPALLAHARVWAFCLRECIATATLPRRLWTQRACRRTLPTSSSARRPRAGSSWRLRRTMRTRCWPTSSPTGAFRTRAWWAAWRPMTAARASAWALPGRSVLTHPTPTKRMAGRTL